MTTIASPASASSTAQDQVEVSGGVDTHRDTHTAAAIDTAGRRLGHRQFPANPAGYRQLLAWLRSLGTLRIVGVEGTGAYGAGLARYLAGEGVAMVEVDRPDRKTRRFAGKSDPIDAEAAARTALANVRTGIPKDRSGQVEALRNLRVARRSAVEQRADCQRQIKTLIVTAVEPLRTQLRDLPDARLITTCAGLRPDLTRIDEPEQATKAALIALPYSDQLHNRFTHLSIASVEEQKRIEQADTLPFEIYRQQYLSVDRLGLPNARAAA